MSARLVVFVVALVSSVSFAQALSATVVSHTNVSCFGGNNGSATVQASGGASPYTYTWAPSGGSGATASGLAAGTYTVTVRDNVGATTSAQVTITQPIAPVGGTKVVTNVACFGGSNGAINLTPTGGTGPYTFSWLGGPTTEDRTGLTAGTYTVVITDANSCTGTVQATVTQPISPVSGTTAATNIACFGGSNGAINLTPSGGTGPYTFSWSGGPITEDRTSLTAGTYTVVITDANSCTGTVQATITQPSPLTGTTTVFNVSCFGGSNGVIDLTPSGGAGGYTYSWGGGVITQDRTSLTAGTYTVTITDANACTANVQATVTQPSAPVGGTKIVNNVSCFGGSNGTINLTPTGGTGPYTFSWVGGPTTEDRTSLAAGTYTVVITDANSCTGTVQATVTQPTGPVGGSTVVTNAACFGGSNGAINLTPTGGTGPYTYSWVGGGSTEDRTSLTAGVYSVVITDANACTGTVQATVTQPTSPVSGSTVVTNVACNGANTGAINLTPSGGIGPYTFNWIGGPTTEDRTSLAAGAYSVVITDANACTATVQATITQPSPVGGSTVVTNVACNGGSNGAINLTPTGGTGPYTFSWLGGPTTEDRTGLSAGTYTVVVTDANSCTGTLQPTVTQPPQLALSGSVANVSCNGGANGSATVSVSGGTPGYTYAWSASGGTSATTTGRTAGTYSVTVSDANACVATRSFTLTEPPALQATVSALNVSCNGGSNGTASVSATGGAPGYTYAWLPRGGTGATATGLSAGSYSVTLTDANACTTTKSVTLTEPSSPVSGSVVATNVACRGSSTGALDLTPAGGVPPYTVSWGGGVTTEDRTGLAAGSYTATVTDTNACTATVQAIVTQPATALGGSIAATHLACNGASNGALDLTPTGGTAPYTFNWGGGVTTEDRTGLGSGAYAVTITDTNSCTATVNATVTQPPALLVTATKQDTCPGLSNGTASASASGGTGAYSYDWSPGMPSGDGTASITSLASGAWSVTVSDENGCSASATATIADLTTLPQAQPQSLTTAEDTALPLTLGVSSACSAMTFAVTTQPRHGTLSGTAPTLTYTPELNFFGADDFAYTVSGTTGTSAAATISIAVTAVNDLPVATAQTLRTERDTPLSVTLTGTDVEGTSLTFAVTTPPQHGALTGTPPALSYAPAAGFVGDDFFAFTAHDGTDTSLPVTVAIVVEAPDAGAPDAGTEPDAGQALPDAGELMADAGEAMADAGETLDAGPHDADAGTGPVDAGVIATLDAGTSGGGEPMPEPSGCGCTGAPGALFAWALGLLLLRRRAR